MADATWDALIWKDGSRYDGQVRGRQCQGIGILRHPNGDRYEGEFRGGSMDGHGVYVWRGGTLYRGQWHGDHMEGCGVRISRQVDGEFLIQEGQFVRDQFLGTFMNCSQSEARNAAAEADMVASRTGHLKNADVYARYIGTTSESSLEESVKKEEIQRRKNWLAGFLKTPKGGNNGVQG